MEKITELQHFIKNYLLVCIILECFAIAAIFVELQSDIKYISIVFYNLLIIGIIIGNHISYKEKFK